MLIGFRVKAAAPPGKIGPPERSKSCRQAQPRMSQPSTRSSLWHQAARRCLTALGCSLVAAITWAQPPVLDAALRNRIDAFVEHERQASGIPGIALAIVQLGSPAHVRGFGDDGHGGKPISADTPFPIGSLTKSFTALLVRQAIDAGQVEADAPVQRVPALVPGHADADASARITLRHLLNQTSGFSRDDGIAPLLQGSTASIDELARGLGARFRSIVPWANEIRVQQPQLRVARRRAADGDGPVVARTRFKTKCCTRWQMDHAATPTMPPRGKPA
jgi:hypothetical protein